MNLPKHERFKRENVILAGIIPGPSEPPRNINTYLSPLVDELLILWNDGIMVRHSSSQIIPERFRAALLCVACDIPASRKYVVSLVTNPGWDVINALRLLQSVVLEFLMTTRALRIAHQEILLNTGE